ncbi:DUF1080 domain-containing protein [Aporhodopirellula aestuarii]|uniref:DUF1080 domain-containing protein n=1 Tax=Aporhodopirellula aestuarii TaxID=2950107 RepID=A0ABT0U6S2_9BACT|nr:DUF1080 domain-containing protein [Aporhodopirellula aestuarii]MCM2372586.1 DUF1080 domain-containing protein [Aporhodopirellula aestuarii]
MNFTVHAQSILANEPNSTIRRPRAFALMTTACLLAVSFVVSANPAICQDSNAESSSVSSQKAPIDKSADRFTPMKGKWKAASFGGDGPIDITKTDDGGELIEMFVGDPLTGIRWEGDFPKENYEIRFEARRLEGFDFFAAITFPVGDQHCSFVLGGWGGGMVGISSIDGNDASSNETTQYKDFETDQWYKIRVRVDEMNVTCWLDDEEYATVPRGEHTLSIRIEMDPCLPLGIANFMTRSELRKIEMRKLNDDATSSELVPHQSNNAPAKSEVSE